MLMPGAHLANADSVRACGILGALTRPNQPSAGGGVIEGGGSAQIGTSLYRLSSALPSAPGTNFISDNVTVGKRVCLTGDLVAGTTDLLNNYLIFASDVDVCGSLSSYSPATATTNNVLSLGFGGTLHDYQLVNAGSAPADLGARSTALNPEIVRLVGRSVQGINTVTDYEVTRVLTCNGLPNTSTANTREGWLAFVLLAVLVLLGAVGVRMRLARHPAAHLN
jgi:hypothetical protein